jgi:CubicO group peptidase (beta-lactamase class C family)
MVGFQNFILMRIVLFLFFFASTSLVAQKYTVKFNLKDSLKRLFKEECVATNFSGVMLVAKEGKPLCFLANGYRDYEKKSNLRKTDIFELASVSKQFTALIIMMLQERGKLGIDDPLNKWIKGLPFEGVSIRHMLTHTSGLPDYQAIMDKHWDKSKVADNIDAIEYLKKYPEPLHFKPGEKYEYSNTGYLLLASIAEVASDANFIQLMHSWVFKPAQMKSADFRTPIMKARISNMAQGHKLDPVSKQYRNALRDPESNYTIWLGNRKGPGRISASALDLLKWDQALYTPLFIAKTTLLEAFSPHTLLDGTISNYGFGWETELHPKLGRIVAHSGDNPGYRTYIKRYIDQNYVVILLNNNESNRMSNILSRIDMLISNKLVFDNADGSMDPLRRRE